MRARRCIGAVSAAALAMALVGCGNDSGAGGSTPGVTDDTIVIGSHVALTGPAAAGLKTYVEGWNAYFDYVNDNGGVHGREIEMVIQDDAYDPTKSGQAARKLVQQDQVFAVMGGTGTPTHAATLDFLNANKVVDLFPATGSPEWADSTKNPYTFGLTTDGRAEGKIIAQYMNDTYPDKSPCVMYQTGETGEMRLEGFRHVIPDGGLGTLQTYAPTDTAVTAQVNALKAAECDVVAWFGLQSVLAQAINTADDIGFRPQFVGAWETANIGSLESLVKDKSLLDGYTAFGYLPDAGDSSNTWAAGFSRIWDEHGSGGTLGSFGMLAMVQAYTAVQALEAAGGDLTRERLLDTLKSMNFDVNPGLVPLSYSEDKRFGYAGGRMSRVENGSFVGVGNTYTTTPDSDAAVEVYEAERPPAPGDLLPTS
jgi:branched-chain amino acid transport system substrate-binding protein